MARKKTRSFWSRIGVWSYVAGIIIALFVSIFSKGPQLDNWAVGTLAILGLIVGLVNIADAEVMLYLAAGIAFIISAGAMEDVFHSLGVAFTALQAFMSAIIYFTAPGLLVVSFKALYEVAKDE